MFCRKLKLRAAVGGRRRHGRKREAMSVVREQGQHGRTPLKAQAAVEERGWRAPRLTVRAAARASSVAGGREVRVQTAAAGERPR